MNKISNILNTPNTPIIITNKSIGEINTLTDQKKTILNRVEDWKKQWMKKDFNNYIKFYEKNAMYNNHLYEKWVERRKKLLESQKI